QRMARAHGAMLRDRTPVTSIEARRDEVVVETADARFSARSLTVAAGPWTAWAVGRFGLRIPLDVTKEQVIYFAAGDLAAFALGTFPIWIWMDDPAFYGFPVFGEPDAVKITQDAGGRRVDPDTRGFEEDPEITARVRGFVERYLPAALGPARLIKTCLYTLPPDRDFILDTLPEHANVAVAVGAGHGYKFAGVLGRVLADLALEGRSPILEESAGIFALDRAILQMESPPRTYMV
ncbi:MAG: FAD-dependent oxidoreductase, partial [Candidatus Eremiobacteraeota bacterium]|nr:FAD-dependent oxidoreductase [Candidatus Eremiobacteraeota bacterium]